MHDCPLPSIVIPKVAVKGGWAVDFACAIDERQPGFLGAYLRSSLRRRQIVHAILGHYWAAADNGLDNIFNSMARNLLLGRERDVVTMHLGSCPSGFLNLLSKLGEHALPHEFYARLHSICGDPASRISVAVLRHLDNIGCETIDIVEALPPGWRRVGLIKKLATARETSDFLRSITFIKRNCPAANGIALDDGMKHLCQNGTIANFVSTWLYRCHFPKGPLPDCDDLQPVRDGKELSSLGVKMKNCLREQIADILKGHVAIYVVRGLGRDVVVMFRRPSRHDTWEFDDVYVTGNQRVEYDLRRAAVEVLARNGFDVEHKGQRVTADDDALQHFLWRARRRYG